jgi:hemerythrin-like domain-containing protein
MANAPAFLNDDGSASMASAFLMSHHGLRRDIARFGVALRQVAAGDHSRVSALRDEWQGYHATLHGHHEVEDQAIFPSMRSEHAALAAVIDQLSADHRRIDPLLDAGDRAFAELPATVDAAATTVAELAALLDAHLAIEEAHVVPLLREARSFPPPATASDAELYAKGFAWSSHGVAPEVLERVYGMLPELLTSRLPAARDAFEERVTRVWGPTKAGASRTAVPDWLAR